MNTEQILSYIQKFFEAAIPVAKQAYEIGLMTLRVDALAQLVPALISAVLLVYAWKKIIKAFQDGKDYLERARNREPGYRLKYGTYDDLSDHVHVLWYLSAFVSTGLTLGVLGILLNVWLWVKLIFPELWLAHTMVDKVLQ